MLVLSRKAGESIDVGDDVKVTVISVKGRRVRLGIEAPGDVRILRTEVDVILDDEEPVEIDV